MAPSQREEGNNRLNDQITINATADSTQDLETNNISDNATNIPERYHTSDTRQLPNEAEERPEDTVGNNTLDESPNINEQKNNLQQTNQEDDILEKQQKWRAIMSRNWMN